MSDLIVIDGHNVVHAVDRYRHLKDGGMAEAMAMLMSDLVNLAGLIETEIIVVFDGRGARSSERISDRLTAIYSAGGQSADAVIERLVFEESGGRAMTVCTADNVMRKVVASKGVHSLFPAGLMDLMEDAVDEARPISAGDQSLRVEDHLSKSIIESLDRLRKRQKPPE